MPGSCAYSLRGDEFSGVEGNARLPPPQRQRALAVERLANLVRRSATQSLLQMEQIILDGVAVLLQVGIWVVQTATMVPQTVVGGSTVQTTVVTRKRTVP